MLFEINCIFKKNAKRSKRNPQDNYFEDIYLIQIDSLSICGFFFFFRKQHAYFNIYINMQMI